MCAYVGVAPPSDNDGMTLHRELSVYVGERAVCAIAGAVDAVYSLYRAGYKLFTASGTTSWELQAILGRMGMVDLFQQLYGPDLIDHVKYGPEFYARIFAHAGVQADRALVIESDLECCQWTVEASGNAVWVDSQSGGDTASLAALVNYLV